MGLTLLVSTIVGSAAAVASATVGILAWVKRR